MLLALQHAGTVDDGKIGGVGGVVVGFLYIRHEVFDEIGEQGGVGVGSIFLADAAEVAQLVDEKAQALAVVLVGVDANGFGAASRAHKGAGVEVAEDGHPRGFFVLGASVPKANDVGIAAEREGATSAQQMVFAAPSADFGLRTAQAFEGLAGGSHFVFGGIVPTGGRQLGRGVEVVDERTQIGQGIVVLATAGGFEKGVFRFPEVGRRQAGEFFQCAVGILHRDASTVVGPVAGYSIVERRTLAIVGNDLINIVVGGGHVATSPTRCESEEQKQTKDDKFLHNGRRNDVLCFWSRGDKG